MKITNTFVRIADDSQAVMGLIPKVKDGKPSVARMHYDLLSEHPYEYDLDAFNFEIWCRRNAIPDQDRDHHQAAFFSKGHPCMRASPLTKTHGFGAHYNGSGKIAIYPVDSKAYQKLLNDPENRVEMAMRSKRPDASTQLARTHPGRRVHAPQSHA
ncbi:hypothetical protein AEAC466_08945 [Asticcacaulis sp. AC466]|uniref:DUF6157 family protein n=1 Tax=Asticcacaulis sp. AC466 TaxID=1282362 RepID=UPI0003C3DC9C|nr:DUF6157 family protein [Asticcacaulis sp. AC466]ESQ84469.1 hypothetical protein AEAC466_08945 [Asticcacaulis sp. AC466]